MGANDTNMAAAEVNRDNVIIKTSIIGILTNVFLAAFKAVIGIVSNSIAVTLDAVFPDHVFQVAPLSLLYCH